MSFDPTNTSTWQCDDDTVFLLEEIPGRWIGTGSERRAATQNRFMIRVDAVDKSTTREERVQLAARICGFLNGA